MDEIQSISAISNRLKVLDPDARRRVLAWLNDKYGTAGPPSGITTLIRRVTPSHDAMSGTGSGSGERAPFRAPDLRPEGKLSARRFIVLNTPGNDSVKCLLAVHYLTSVSGLAKVGIGHVSSFFQEVHWHRTTNLAGALRRSVSAGYLSADDADDIRMTPFGRGAIDDVHSRLPIRRTIALSSVPARPEPFSPQMMPDGHA